MEKHKHHDLIILNALGHPIEQQNEDGDWNQVANPTWDITKKYRVMDPARLMKLEELLAKLVIALETTYISSYQSTVGWDKELTSARDYLVKAGLLTSQNKL